MLSLPVVGTRGYGAGTARPKGLRRSFALLGENHSQIVAYPCGKGAPQGTAQHADDDALDQACPAVGIGLGCRHLTHLKHVPVCD